jgi:Protein of unknown function (DUF2846)
MSRLLRPLIVLMLLVIAGCAPPPQAGALRGPLPPQVPGTARLVFYRPTVYYGPMEWMAVYLNGRETAVSQPGAVFYRDVAPGTYHLTMQTYGFTANQFKTVAVRAGQVVYVNIDTLPRLACGQGRVVTECSDDTFIMTIVDPARGFSAIQGLRLIQG